MLTWLNRRDSSESCTSPACRTAIRRPLISCARAGARAARSRPARSPTFRIGRCARSRRCVGCSPTRWRARMRGACRCVARCRTGMWRRFWGRRGASGWIGCWRPVRAPRAWRAWRWHWWSRGSSSRARSWQPRVSSMRPRRRRPWERRSISIGWSRRSSTRRWTGFWSVSRASRRRSPSLDLVRGAHLSLGQARP